jgi:dUTP pyrophosphatase
MLKVRYFEEIGVRMLIKVKKVDPNAIVPKYQTEGAACFDLHACLEKEESIDLGHIYSTVVIATGLQFEIPEGYVMLIYSRSGHGFKHDVSLSNCTGVIDSDYRGPVQIKLSKNIEAESKSLTIKHGDRIAQAMIIPISRVELEEVEELSETERGAGGFGSTGT